MSASAPQPERVETGEWIGRYRLCFEIATGGMATVYLARSEGPGGFEKLVALKRVRQAYSEEQEFVDMFLDEARIASKISHANVCQVFDFGEADGAHYITMEYLSGAPLSRVRARLTESLTPQQDRLAPWAIAAVLAGVAEGLHAAHELRGEDQEPLHVVHRDVSPQNIFLTYDGVGKVLDFGVASARNRLHKTTSGTVKGKHGYMAPEQLTALPIDRRTDVWALGVVLWEMLARRPLFRGRNESETLYAVVNGTVPPPSEVRDGVPPALEEVAMAALQREPEDRYASAREMGRALRRALASHGEPVGPAEIAEWMQELFAVDRERELEMIETARRHAEPRPLRERTGAITVTRSTGGVAAPPPPTGGSRAPLLPLALQRALGFRADQREFGLAQRGIGAHQFNFGRHAQLEGLGHARMFGRGGVSIDLRLLQGVVRQHGLLAHIQSRAFVVGGQRLQLRLFPGQFALQLGAFQRPHRLPGLDLVARLHIKMHRARCRRVKAGTDGGDHAAIRRDVTFEAGAFNNGDGHARQAHRLLRRPQPNISRQQPDQQRDGGSAADQRPAPACPRRTGVQHPVLPAGVTEHPIVSRHGHYR